MSISVRCPGCEKGMGVPEKYAGRSVKCPACKTPIDVPGGDRPQRSRQPAGAAAGEGGGRRAPSRGKPTRSGGGRPAGDRGGTKRPKRAVSDPDTDGDFLGGLDLDRIDRAGEIEICPKCATELREDSDICPKCGFDISTGAVDKKFARQLANKGPAPSEYYKQSLPDAKEFLFSNLLLVRKTSITWTIFGVLAGISFWFVSFVVGVPTRVFWSAMSLLSVCALAGWFWYLGGMVTKLTMLREKAADRLSIDFFETLAIGFRAVVWPFIMGLPIWVCVGPILLVGLAAGSVVAQIVFATLYFGLYLLFPLAQVHRVQRYTYKASILWELLKILPKNFGPLCFYLAVAAGLALPFVGVLAAVQIWGGGINPVTNEYVVKAATWTATQITQMADVGKSEDSYVFKILFGMTDVLIATIVTALFMIPASFPAVFLMRLNGTLGLYNARRLDLVQKVAPGTPAPFWVRVLAGCGDMFAIPFTSFLVNKEKLAVMVAWFLNAIALVIWFTFGREMLAMLAPVWVIYNLWMYYAVSEASTTRATIGKETYGLVVVPEVAEDASDEEKRELGRLDVKHATGRFFVWYFTQAIGLVVAAFHPEKRSLADLLSKTRVVFKGDR